MSKTYSINIGTEIETDRELDLNSVLQKLPNNTQKMITPKDVRSSFLTIWANTGFKLTTANNIEYIGIDSGDPNNRDSKSKILLGKRIVGGQNVMTSYLLSNDIDLYFYNTKKTGNNNSTKISILVGESPMLWSNCPYIESLLSNGLASLNIINPTSDIFLESLDGSISINNIIYPRIDENINIDNKVLRYEGLYPYGKLVWSEIYLTSVDMGNSAEFNIKGDPVLLNGYNLEFTEDRLVPIEIGGIEQGSSFPINSFPDITDPNAQNWPIVEVLRLLLYPYVKPDIVFNLHHDNGILYYDYKITSYARDITEIISKITLKDNGINPSGNFLFILSGNQIIYDNLRWVPGSTITASGSIDISSYSYTGSVDFALFVSNDVQSQPGPDILYCNYNRVKTIDF